MRLTVLGSGGAFVTPRPGCACRACAAARAAGGRHRRGGPCLYVHDAHALVDTPEDVVPLLDRAGVDRVDHLLLTHWHPDHTAGFRVVEALTWDLATGGARRTIEVWLGRATLDRHAPSWRYFERRGYCRLNVVEPGTDLPLGPLTARTFAYAPDGFLTGFLLSDGGARVLLALDETKGLAAALPEWARRPDLLIAECGFFDHDPDGGTIVPPFWPMRRTEASWEADTLPLVRAVGARRSLLVHLMGCLTGRTPDELDALAASLPELHLAFAHDGLTVVAP
jgi:hypothetical protein